MSTLDYHIHTIVSTDADYTPAEIIRMAKENGVKTLAITDHNHVASVAAVSYTHLDVYKRQINGFASIAVRLCLSPSWQPMKNKL